MPDTTSHMSASLAPTQAPLTSAASNMPGARSAVRLTVVLLIAAAILSPARAHAQAPLAEASTSDSSIVHGSVVDESGSPVETGTISCVEGCKDLAAPITHGGRFRLAAERRHKVVLIVDPGPGYHPVPVMLLSATDHASVSAYPLGNLSDKDAVKVLANYSMLYALTSLMEPFERPVALELYRTRLRHVLVTDYNLRLLINDVRRIYSLAPLDSHSASTSNASLSLSAVEPKHTPTLWEIPSAMPSSPPRPAPEQ